ncbi:ATP-binding protein [Kineococcus sp. SYSU DK005]|uniref:ATP-binding protein n=1 Tax=Kineococcus sp. SYSU DK005 TaxID=3383126 RepID=UPI003D7D12AB
MCTITAASEVVLPLQAHDPELARDFLREVICRAHYAAALDGAELLLEVATNGVRCGAPPLVLEVDCESPAGLRIALSDACGAQPVPRTAGEQDEGARGMTLVGFISKAWGVQANGSRKTLWFCLVSSPRRPGPHRR